MPLNKDDKGEDGSHSEGDSNALKNSETQQQEDVNSSKSIAGGSGLSKVFTLFKSLKS